MNNIDCLLIGFNYINITRQRQILRMQYGKKSHIYNVTNMSQLGFIKYNNELYSQSDIFTLTNNEYKITGSEYEEIGIGENLSLTITYLGSYLHKNGFSFDYVNNFQKEKNQLKEKLKKNNYSYIIIPTSIYIFAYPIVEIISFVKQYNSEVKIILGGTFIANQLNTINDQEKINDFLKMFNADFIFNSYEGEQSLVKLLNALKENKSFKHVENLYYLDNSKYYFTLEYQEENDINDNLINWNLFNNTSKKFTSIRTSISCPFSCSFCNFPRYAGKYRYASVDRIEKEMLDLKNETEIEGLWIIDDTLNFPPKRFKEILKMMIRNKFNFKWHSHFRCQYADREMVELMKESGCVHLILGLESGSQTILDNMNKMVTVDSYKKGLGLLKEYEIPSTALFIIGYPGEDMNTYNETCNFIEENKPDFFQARLWWADPDTPIYQKKDQFCITGSGFSWKHNTMDSDKAHGLTLEMFNNINNSIFESDFPLPFHMLVRDIPINTVKTYINTFNYYVKKNVADDLEKNITKEELQKIKETLFSNNILVP